MSLFILAPSQLLHTISFSTNINHVNISGLSEDYSRIISAGLTKLVDLLLARIDLLPSCLLSTDGSFHRD